MATDRNLSRTETLALALAEKHGVTHDQRHAYMVGSMGASAEELERVLGLIAKRTTTASEARLLAANALASLSIHGEETHD